MPLETSLAPDELRSYYRALIDREFPDARHTAADVDRVLARGLERVEHSFAHVALAGYHTLAGKARFSHLHGDQAAAFYYFAANSAWREFEDEALATRFFLLNKRHNALVCMYDTQLPEVFVLIHTVGTVLGKAAYGNFLAVYQNVTVGAEDGRRPLLGARAVLYGGSMILGGATLGDDVTVSAGTTLIDAAIPADSVVAGSSRDLIVRPRKRNFAQQYWI
jgi:serine O-acetyltransferase